MDNLFQKARQSFRTKVRRLLDVDDDEPQVFKLLIVGDSQVGKSALISKFCDDVFPREYEETVVVEYNSTDFTARNGKKVIFKMWDAGGNERYRSLINSYYRGCSGVLVLFDVTKTRSFMHVQHWIDEASSRSGGAPCYVVATKCDATVAARRVSREQLRSFSEEHAVTCKEISSRTSAGIYELFHSMIPGLGLYNKTLKAKAKAEAPQPQKSVRTRVEEASPPQAEYTLLKVIIVGGERVGKSKLLDRTCRGEYTDSQYLPTIGIDFGYKMFENTVDDEVVKLQLWDTAGQERFKSITKSFYQKSDGCIVMFDVSNMETFLHVADYVNDIKMTRDESFPILLLGNKCDKKDRELDYTTVKQFARGHRIDYMEISVKNGTNIDAALVVITSRIRAYNGAAVLKKNVCLNRQNHQQI